MDPKQLRLILREELGTVKDELGTVRGELESFKKSVQAEFGTVREELKEGLGSVKEELKSIKKTQKEHTEKIDALTEEMFTVHQLASTTLDVVKGRYEKNKREIDEVKDRLNMPKEPYFGD